MRLLAECWSMSLPKTIDMETPEEFFNDSSYVTSEFLHREDDTLGLNTDALFSIMKGYADSCFMAKVEAEMETYKKAQSEHGFEIKCQLNVLKDLLKQ